MHVRMKNGDLKALKCSNLRKVHQVNHNQSPEVARVKALFRKYDTNGDGAFQVDEFKRFLAALGLDKVCMKSMMQRVDTNGDGVIQYEEFVDWVLGDDMTLDAQAPQGVPSPNASPHSPNRPHVPLDMNAVDVDSDSDSDDDNEVKRTAHRDITTEEVIELCGELPYGWTENAIKVLNNMRRRFPDYPVQKTVTQMRKCGYHGGDTLAAIRKTGAIEVEVMPAAAVTLNKSGRQAFPALYQVRTSDSGLDVYEQSGQNFTFRNLRDGKLKPIGSIRPGERFRILEVRKDPDCGGHYGRVYFGTNAERYHWVSLGRDLSRSRSIAGTELSFVGAERLDPS